MVFSSLFFLFAFFPIFMLCHSLAKSIRKKNVVILIFSLLFYTWGEPKYVLLLLFMTFTDWLGALMIEKAGNNVKQKKFILTIVCIINLGLIAIFKYTSFLCGNLHALIGIPEIIPDIALPIGISFYTFQLLSYVVDVYRGDVNAQKSFPIVLLYVSLFHQCIAGPIVRYKDIENEIFHRRVTVSDISKGIMRFTTGLAKKALVANLCGELADTFLVATSMPIDQAIATLNGKSAASMWLGVLAYSLQIYFDFSAYSDMAIGMGWMIGFHYKENFDYPYTANSVTMFWRKWHISLGTFFRDYVYIPLGGNRKGVKRTYINLFIVWFLTGLWHGASWNFVLWGLYFFVFLVLEKRYLLKAFKKLPKIVSHLYLCLVVYFGWILFRYDQLPIVGTILKGMLGLNGNPATDFETSTKFNQYLIFIILAIIGTTPMIKFFGYCWTRLRKKLEGIEKARLIYVPVVTIETIMPVVWLVLSTASLVGSSYNPFLYFQF